MASREEADDPLDRGPGSTPASPPPPSRPRPLQLETQRGPSRSPATPGPDQTRGHHRRASSLTSPPPPPEDFNPPADFTPTDSALQGIQAPPPPTAVQTASSTSSHSPQSSVGSADDGAMSPLAGGRQSTSTPVETFLQRPQIRAIQRLSQESVNQSCASSRSSTNDGSDSSEVLAARRGELMSQLLTGEQEMDTSIRPSGETPSRRSSTPPPSDCPLEVNIIGATPSNSSTQLTEDALLQVHAEESTRRPSFGSPLSDSGNDDAGAHAWDSVVSRYLIAPVRCSLSSGPHQMRNPSSAIRHRCRQSRGSPQRPSHRMLHPRSRPQWSRLDVACRRPRPTRRCHECSVNRRLAGNAQTRVPTTACLRHDVQSRPHHRIRRTPKGRPPGAQRRAHALRPLHRPLHRPRPPRRARRGPRRGAPAEADHHGGLQDPQVRAGHRRHHPYNPPRTMEGGRVGVRGLRPSSTSSQS